MSHRFEVAYPTLANVPITFLGDEAVSIKELNARSISFTAEAERIVEAEKISAGEGSAYILALAVAYYLKLASSVSPMVSIVGFGIPTMSPHQALDEVRNNTETGVKLVRMYVGLRQEVLNKSAQF